MDERGRRRAAGSRISDPGNGTHNSESGWPVALSAGRLLFAPQHQQLSIGSEDLAQSVLKLAAGVDTPPDIVHPVVRNPFDATLPLRHEGEKPDGMALARGAVACRLAAAAVREGERAWQEILGEGKLAQAGELTLPEAGSFRAFGADIHLEVIIHTEQRTSQDFLRTRK